jgi:hypothetical protein
MASIDIKVWRAICENPGPEIERLREILYRNLPDGQKAEKHRAWPLIRILKSLSEDLEHAKTKSTMFPTSANMMEAAVTQYVALGVIRVIHETVLDWYP